MSAGTASTSSASSAPFRIPSLDGLRAVAFGIVFFSHVGGTRFSPGGFGVTIFFFLSGFLITTLLRLEEETHGAVSLKQFYLRRVLRILPPMYIGLVFALALSALVGTRISSSALAAQSLHFTNYHIALGGKGRAIGTDILWSLSVEEHFYLLFPFAYVALRRWVRAPERQAGIILGFCGIVLAWRLVLVLILRASPDYTMYATDTRIDSILFGCALALYRNPALPGPQIPARWVWTAAVLGIVVLVGSIAARNAVFRETARYTLQGAALVPVFVAAVRFPTAWVFRLLNTPLARWLGTLSYGLYLLHLPVITTLRMTFPLSEGVLTLLSLAISLALAALLYSFVELPCAKLRRRLSRAAALAR